MKEITNKLADELVHKLDALESFIDEQTLKENEQNRGKKRKERRYEWGTAGCMCFDIRVHLYHHMKDMIDHPAYQPREEVEA